MAVALMALLASAVLWAAPDAPPSFSGDVAPILSKNCLPCHGPAQQMSQLDLSTRAAALKGGQKSGPPLLPETLLTARCTAA